MTTLKPFLSVTPLKGFHQNYDALPDGPHGSVYLRTYGGHTEHSKGVGNPGGNDLESQAANDEILLGFDPVDPKHESIENRAGDVLAKNALVFDFRADQVSSSSQFLMLFGLRGIGWAQYFVGLDLVYTQALEQFPGGPTALLIDSTGYDVKYYFNCAICVVDLLGLHALPRLGHFSVVMEATTPSSCSVSNLLFWFLFAAVSKVRSPAVSVPPLANNSTVASSP